MIDFPQSTIESTNIKNTSHKINNDRGPNSPLFMEYINAFLINNINNYKIALNVS